MRTPAKIFATKSAYAAATGKALQPQRKPKYRIHIPNKSAVIA